MTTSRGVVVVFAIIAAITTGSFLTGTGAAHDNKPRAKIDKVEAQLAEHEKRIAALEAMLGIETATSTQAAATENGDADGDGDHHGGDRGDRSGGDPKHIRPKPVSSTTTTVAPAPQTETETTTTTTAPAPAPAPSSGGCNYPSGDPAGAQQIGDQRLSAGQTLENFVLNSGGNHAILPPNVSGVTVRNGSVYANGADNIKFGDHSVYRDLYLVMADSGAHLDAMQGQAAIGVDVDNVTIVMKGHGGVTGAILFQTLAGGGGDVHRDITFDLNCINLIGTGPYGFDIRVDYKNGADVTGRITNVNMAGQILITDRGGGGSCRIEVDASALPHVNNNGCEIVPI